MRISRAGPTALRPTGLPSATNRPPCTSSAMFLMSSRVGATAAVPLSRPRKSDSNAVRVDPRHLYRKIVYVAWRRRVGRAAKLKLSGGGRDAAERGPEASNAASRTTRRLWAPTQHLCNSPEQGAEAGGVGCGVEAAEAGGAAVQDAVQVELAAEAEHDGRRDRETGLAGPDRGVSESHQFRARFPPQRSPCRCPSSGTTEKIQGAERP